MCNNNILKHNNGSVIEPLKKGTKYFHFTYSNLPGSYIEKYTWLHDSLDTRCLISRNVFLTRKEAEKALEMMQVQNRLIKKIKEIDRDNGWVADWNDNEQDKYYLCFDYKKNSKYWLYTCYHDVNSIYMSEQARDYMMSDAVSLKDFKLFLEIMEDEEDSKKAEYMKQHDELIALAMELKKKAEAL